MVTDSRIITPARRREIGATGTPIFGGKLTTEDYNVDLIGAARWRVYNRMRTSDGTVAGALRQLKLPLMRAKWDVVPVDQSAKQKEIAEFVEDDLMGMTVSWNDYLRHILLILDLGVSPFEKVWELRRDRRIHLRKLAWRSPSTVVDWLVDETGGPRGINQQLMSDKGGIVEIPIEKLLIFSHDAEGSDIRGTAMLRAAYKHWWYKQGMESVDAVAKEKRGMGIDVMNIDSTATQADQEKAEAALQTLRSHQRNFLVVPRDVAEYEIQGIGASSVLSTLESIEYHDLRILRAMSAEILAMVGQGSYAMRKDTSAMLLYLIEGIGRIVTTTHNKYLIPQMVQYNFGEQEKYPQLAHAKLDVREIAAYADALSKLIGSNALTLGRDIEDDVREVFGFPDLPEDVESIADNPPVQEPDPDSPTAVPSGRPPLPERPVAAQRDKLLELAHAFFKKGNSSEVLDVSIPYKRAIATALGGTIEANVQASQMATRVYEAYTTTLLAQMRDGRFNGEELGDAIQRAQR